MTPIRTHVNDFVETRLALTNLVSAVASEEASRTSEDAALDERLTAAETDIGNLESADTALDGRLDTAEADIDALQNVNNSYGELLVTTGAGQALTGGAGAVEFDQFDTETSDSGDVNPDHSGNRITFAQAGTYLVWYVIRATLSGGSAFTSQLFLNGSLLTPRMQATVPSGTEIDVMRMGYLTVAANDYIELYIATSNSVTVTSASNGETRMGAHRIK